MNEENFGYKIINFIVQNNLVGSNELIVWSGNAPEQIEGFISEKLAQMEGNAKCGDDVNLNNENCPNCHKRDCEVRELKKQVSFLQKEAEHFLGQEGTPIPKDKRLESMQVSVDKIKELEEQLAVAIKWLSLIDNNKNESGILKSVKAQEALARIEEIRKEKL